jgi:hypothetical protein
MYSPHFRLGRDGYIFFLWNSFEYEPPNCYWPYYCESFDYGLTWTQPQLIWQDSLPYSDMSNVTGWWYDYDCEVVNDTPVATLELSTQNNDYGEIWVYRPASGSPGSWNFVGTKLVGGDSTAPQPYARFPTVAADNRGDIFIGYQAIFMTPTDTGPDVGMFERRHYRNRWEDWGQITHNFNNLEEKMLEFAHNAPRVLRDSIIIGMIYTDAGDYPTTGNLYFDYATIPPYPGISEDWQGFQNPFEITVEPNPFRNSVKFIIPPIVGKTRLSIFDATGKLVTSHPSPVASNCFVWDGKKFDGSLANPGIYFFKISTPNGLAQGKVILAR